MKHRDELPFGPSTVFEVGDTVECISTGYQSVKPGETRTVLATRDSPNGYYLWLNNRHSPEGGSWFLAYNFRLVKRRPKVANNLSLHIAVQLSDDGNEEFGYDYIANVINDLKFTHLSMMAETSAATLKKRVVDRIKAHPEERWLIMSGNTLGEVAGPPVRFRSV